MSKEIPILFSTPMVQAILEERKTMTRRIVKDITITDPLSQIEKDTPSCINGDCGMVQFSKWQPGDLLWVRETWGRMPDGDLVFKAGATEIQESLVKKYHKWRPNIHMPKAAARIWLEVTNVRVERLQNISPGDACVEGVEYWDIDHDALEGGELQADFKNYTWTEKKEKDQNYEDRHFPTFANPVDSFRSLWQSINGPESWEANHWVWVVSFRVLSTKGKP